MVLMGMLWFIQSGSLQAQVINNEGAVISVTTGTAVQGDTLENTEGTLINEGIINLNGNFYNKTLGITQGNGIFNLKGNWANTGTFIANSGSVNLIGSDIQTISSTGGEQFYNLNIQNSGGSFASNRIILLNNVNVANRLGIAEGNIETQGNILHLENAASNSLVYSSTTGSRIVGLFERGVGNTTNYLFPLGSADNYNPMNLTFNDVTAGSILSEFVASDPDSIGLPLPDPGYVNPADSVEVYDADSTGYWSVTAKTTFASNDFDVNLDGTGFETPFQNATRIIKRTDSGDWTLDGDHQDAVGSVAYRNALIGGIDNSPGHHFGWGHIRPRIQTQPEDTAICDGENATFSIVATGRGGLSYVWQVLEGSGGWLPIDNNFGGLYANYETDTLLIIGADTSMNGYKYRAIVRDSLGNFHRSNSQATLTVSPRPVATATPQNDTICNGSTTHIELNSTVPGTTFDVDTLYAGSILGANSNLDGDTIKDILVNPTLYADSVVYRIFPTGPTYPNCGGTADTVVVWVEPNVVIKATSDTICNTDFTDIDITSENVTTNGIHYTWTATATDPQVSGFTTNSVGQDTSVNLTEQLVNTGLDSAIVHYTITPWTLDASGNLKCSGTPINIDIWVEPRVNISAVNDTLCNGKTTDIDVLTSYTTTNGIFYTWTATATDPDVSGYTDNSTGQDITVNITETLDNSGTDSSIVHYTITPWSLDGNGNLKCQGVPVSVDIWVNPTPVVLSSVALDTICNDTRTSITLTTPNVMTVGDVTFDYVSSADPFLTGNSSGNGLNDSDIIDDSLHNSTTLPAYPQVVRYTITPRAIAAGCADGTSITDSITVHPTPDTHMSSDSVKCYLESNGKATVLAENGINIFTYKWDDPANQNTSTATNLVEDLYTVTVTDNQGCTKVDSVNVGQPDRLIPFIDSVKSVSCNGLGDGFIIMDPYGGNGQYFYNWNTGDAGSSLDTLENLGGGYYTVTITDWKGCGQDTTITVGEAPQLSIELLVDDVSCYGADDGSIEVDAVGTYTYIWSTGETTKTITNKSPESYSVTATDVGGCKYIGEDSIREPNPLVIDSIVSTPISCAGDADGELDIFVSGGNTDIPYTYNWYTPDGTGLATNTEDQTGLSGGKYYVTVNDWRGCTTNDSSEVSEPPIFESSINTYDVACFGENKGEIDLSVSGGNTEEDYRYYWATPDGSGLSEDSEDQSGLSAGNYFVTITDAKDCQIQNSTLISEPDLLEITVDKTDINCFGNNDGTATVDIWGGTSNYSIEWSNGASQDSIFNLAAGYYEVTVTDDNGCDTISSFELTEPDEFESIVQFDNITCFGQNNGQIVVTPTGGTTPYSYVWNDSSIPDDSIATNLGPGQYTISVVDNNNCENISNVELTQPDPLIADIYAEDITCYGENDGYISISMYGGTPEYTYTWNNGYAEPSADMLSDGLYSIRISDLHDCQVDTSIYIEEPEPLKITPRVIRPTCPDIQNGSIELNINGGRTPYIVYWDNGSFDENLYDIRSGIYDVLVTDSSLCEIDSSFVVKSAHNFCIDIPNAFSPDGDGINEKWSIDMRDLYPYAEVEIFDRWGNRIFYSKGYEESQYWDGTANGKELPMDTYYYIIYLRNGSKRISGAITLMR